LSFKHLLTVLLLLGVLGLVLFLPSLIDNPSHPRDETLSYPECNLNKGVCTYSSLLYGDMSITVLQNEFPALEPLKVALTSDSTVIKSVVVSIDGKDMFMGINQAVLTQSGSDGRWEGVITIPVCTVDADMAWVFSITLKGLETERLVFNIKSKH